ncbi:hypothetical protein IJI02_01150 [Candidatus Saccharibacteria bacterium]|nr:hypothetical protein [Candidatus Saccharibacteria bacterium]
MKHFAVILSVLTFFFASLGGLNFLNYMTNLASTSSGNSSPVQAVPTFPLDATLDLSLRSETSTLASFSAELKIDRNEYLFLKTSGLGKFFRALAYADFAELFADFDAVWWSIDLWSEAFSDQIGSESAAALRDFVSDLATYDRASSPLLRYSLEDGLLLEVKITFPDAAFSTPDEYLDFSDYFSETFEFDLLRATEDELEDEPEEPEE